MRTITVFITLLSASITCFGEEQPATSPEENIHALEQTPSRPSAAKPIFLTANDMSIATGQPSLVNMSHGSTHIPVWSLSGGTTGQSVVGIVNGLPRGCGAVRVEIVVTTTDPSTSPEYSDVYRVHLSQLVSNAPFTDRYSLGKTVQTPLPAGPLHTRTIVLEPYYEVDSEAPLWVRIQREPGESGDTFTRPTGLAVVKVTPLNAIPQQTHIVQDVSGYNSWPMIQAIENKLVCTYSRGSGHTIGEDARGVYARTSTDGGKTWSKETVVANTPGYGEVTVGKGLDSTGAMLLWVRRIGKDWNHDLYRTTDGVTFTHLATPNLAVQPMQITDVFAVPDVGLMALWFAGKYNDDPVHAWGTMTSSDDGATWTQKTIESGLTKKEWPTEPAAAYLGNGRILAIGRTETGPTQYQMISTDNGSTWTRARTNIGDVMASTPSLVFDAETGLLSNYYYERGHGLLRCRVVDPRTVFENPLAWPASEVVATGSKVTFDSGNANATVANNKHYVSFYSGKAPDTSVMVSEIPVPTAGQ
ncbi:MULTISPECIES: sialidase family protein [Pirellulaceae]|uniref:sialidase family protein n=1 Tax=Pirellulaceae TaxID=2691357 RepID=UPI001E5E8FA2|nr:MULTISPECIES: sialidase family protein [Pirellulaceae]